MSRCTNERNNIGAYEVKAGTSKQVTQFTDFDITFPSLGPDGIVFQAGRASSVKFPFAYLTSVSPFKAMATDGTDLGWNKPAVAAAPLPPPPTQTPVPAVSPVIVTTTSLPAGRTTVPYAALVAASGGSGSFKWTVTSAALPPGLTLDGNTGGITGTPTATGTATFTVRVADAADPTKTASVGYTVAVTAPVSITTTALPNAVKSRAYTATVVAARAVGEVTWTLTVGRVPPGLTLDPATGTISGKPTGPGGWTFTIKATDASSSATASLTIQVDRK